MIALGIDPGLASTGWGVVAQIHSRFKMIDYGFFSTTAGLPIGERLLIIHGEVQKLIRQFKPDVCGVETLYFSKNISSALPVAQSRGVILLVLQQHAIPIIELAPNQIKKSVVGIAKAQKEQVSEMMRILLGLSEVPKPSHAADALAMAYCALSPQGVIHVP
jgi:crossover junction endodeoxyribonuclease RuvC